MRSWGWSPHDGMSALIRWQRIDWCWHLAPSTTWGQSKRVVVCKPRRGLSPATKSARTLIMDFPELWETDVCGLSYLIHCILLQHPAQTNTDPSLELSFHGSLLDLWPQILSKDRKRFCLHMLVQHDLTRLHAVQVGNASCDLWREHGRHWVPRLKIQNISTSQAQPESHRAARPEEEVHTGVRGISAETTAISSLLWTWSWEKL